MNYNIYSLDARRIKFGHKKRKTENNNKKNNKKEK